MKKFIIVPFGLLIFAFSFGLVIFLSKPGECKKDDIACWVNRLDTVNSVYDPLVTVIAQFGEPAIPFLLKKVSSLRSITSLSASWALKEIKSEKAIPLLLEAEESGRTSGAPRAIAMILDERKDLWEPYDSSRVDSERGLLYQEILSQVTSNDKKLMPNYVTTFGDWNSQTHKGDVIVADNEINHEYNFSIEGRRFRVLNILERSQLADNLGDYLFFRFHDVCIYNFPNNPMIGTQSGPEAIAIFWLDMPWCVGKQSRSVYLSGGGAKTVWVKRENKWKYITMLDSWVS